MKNVKEDLKDALYTMESAIDDLRSIIDDIDSNDTSNTGIINLATTTLLDLQKAELLKIAESKFTLQELEERFGFNSANHDVN